MNYSELKIGRTFGVSFDHGDEFFTELEKFCKIENIKQGYIPYFLAGFSEIEMVGTDKDLDPKAPIWDSIVVKSVDAFGGGTFTYDIEKNKIIPHIHISIGEKLNQSAAKTGHLKKGKILFLVEMIVVEIIEPKIERIKNKKLYNLDLINFGKIINKN